MMEDQVCPKCKTSRYRNPSMRLMVNSCGHNLCESCVELLFVKGSGSCPECRIPLRKVNFRLQLFDDPTVDREVDIRRRILREFNKKQVDFPSLRAYNDYLEMVEDIIFNLSNNIDVLETNKRIAEYKEANKEIIAKNRNKQSKESIEIEDILLEEAKMSELKRKEMILLEENEKAAKVREKEKMIDELMFSDSDANSIVTNFNRPKFSTGLDVLTSLSKAGGPALAVVPTPIEDTSEPYTYVDLELSFEGPCPPVPGEDLKPFCRHVRPAKPPELAAGYVESIACLRILQEAMSGLYYSPISD